MAAAAKTICSHKGRSCLPTTLYLHEKGISKAEIVSNYLKFNGPDMYIVGKGSTYLEEIFQKVPKLVRK